MSELLRTVETLENSAGFDRDHRVVYSIICTTLYQGTDETGFRSLARRQSDNVEATFL